MAALTPSSSFKILSLLTFTRWKRLRNYAWPRRETRAEEAYLTTVPPSQDHRAALATTFAEISATEQYCKLI